MITLPLTKAESEGNDFLIYDGSLNDAFTLEQVRTLCPELCDRRYGLGADGLLFLRKIAKGEWRWDFLNKDASEAEMCGNASRCVGRYLAVTHAESQSTLTTAVGKVGLSSTADAIDATMPFKKGEPQKIDERHLHVDVASFVVTGTPHVLLATRNLEAVAANSELIQAMRWHSVAGPRGANVTVYQELGPGEISTATFERGVEGFTLSCGTAKLAVASLFLNSYPIVIVRSSGGESKITTQADGHLVYQGKANLVASIMYYLKRKI